MFFFKKTTIFLIFLLANFSIKSKTLHLYDFYLIDGTGTPATKIHKLVIEDGIITQIEHSEKKITSIDDAETNIIKLNGAYVIPGLIDTHVHVARYPETLKVAKKILTQAVHGGVTSVRDMGGDTRVLAEINRSMLAGTYIGPTVIYSAMMGGPRLFEDERINNLSLGYQNGTSPWMQSITSTTDLKIAVALAKGSGANGLKPYADIDKAIMNKLVWEAKKQHLSVWAHATLFPASPGELVLAGVNSLSHAPYLVWEAQDKVPADYARRTSAPWKNTPVDHPAIIELFKQMKKHHVSLDATLYVFINMANFSPDVKADWTKEASAWANAVTKIAYQNGVSITTGTDWFEPSDKEILPHTHEEMRILVKQAGLSPIDAITAATKNGAEALGIIDERGTLEVNKAADLVVLEKNPLEDINNTRSIRFTLKNGVMLKPLQKTDKIQVKKDIHL